MKNLHSRINAEGIINRLRLERHPEGGYFRETYRSVQEFLTDSSNNAGPVYHKRNCSTAIYYLLQENDFSAFHSVCSDEIWHFYSGDSVLLHMLENENVTTVCLGSNILNGEKPQYTVPACTLFAAALNKKKSNHHGYALCGCTVSPGFNYDDFYLPGRDELLAKYKGQADIITEFTRIM